MKLDTCCQAGQACSVKASLCRQLPLQEGAVAKCMAGLSSSDA